MLTCQDSRFIRGHAYNIDSAFKQYKATRAWRDQNHLIELYDSIDVPDYEETRKMVRATSIQPRVQIRKICLTSIP